MLEIGNVDGERLRFIKELLEKFPNEDQFQVFVHLGSEVLPYYTKTTYVSAPSKNY